MSQVGTEENPLRVAIIGAGPAGFYAAEHILKNEATHAQVDLYDRLPTPYGLVRGGVAPDHPKIKSVIRVYEKTAARDGFRFFGNVKVGHDIEVEDLERRGRAQAAFTNPEIKELGEMADADIVVAPAEVELDPASQAWLESDEADKTSRVNVEIVREFSQREPEGKKRRIVMRF